MIHILSAEPCGISPVEPMIEPVERRISPAESVALRIRKFTNHDYLADSSSIGWLAPPGNSWCRFWLGCWLGTTFLGGSLLTSTLPWFLGRTTASLITTTRLSSFTHFWVEKSQIISNL